MSSVQKIDKICKSVIALTDADFLEVEKMAAEQSAFTHPLKGAKQKKFNELGAHNKRVLSSLKDLRKVIVAFQD